MPPGRFPRTPSSHSKTNPARALLAGFTGALLLLPGPALADNGFLQTIRPGFPWPFLLALAFLAAGLWTPKRVALPSLKHIATPFALFLGALLLRLGFGIWAPLHVNSQGPMWVEGAALLEFPRMYGPGYAQFLHPVTLLWPQRPDLALFAGNVLVSALLPLLVLGVGKSLGLNRFSFASPLPKAISPSFCSSPPPASWHGCRPSQHCEMDTSSRPHCLPWRALFLPCKAFAPTQRRGPQLQSH